MIKDNINNEKDQCMNKEVEHHHDENRKVIFVEDNHHEQDGCKLKHRGEDEKRQINNRISRIEGQIRGVRQMIENDKYCDDVLIQISAVNNSIKSLGRILLNNHIKSCVKQELLKGNDDIIEDVIKSFSKLY